MVRHVKSGIFLSEDTGYALHLVKPIDAGGDGVEAMIEVKVTPQRDMGFDAVAARIYRFDEVKSVYLMSGSYDLQLEIKGRTLNEVAYFVSSKLSTIDGVLSTSTHFLLKKYKEAGKLMQEEDDHERLQVTP